MSPESFFIFVSIFLFFFSSSFFLCFLLDLFIAFNVFRMFSLSGVLLAAPAIWLLVCVRAFLSVFVCVRLSLCLSRLLLAPPLPLRWSVAAAAPASLKLQPKNEVVNKSFAHAHCARCCVVGVVVVYASFFFYATFSLWHALLSCLAYMHVCVCTARKYELCLGCVVICRCVCMCIGVCVCVAYIARN